jgi:aminoglycoside phosphotransferase (APT) family kinase protein
VVLVARPRTPSPATLAPTLSGQLGHGPVRRICADPLGHGVAEVLEACLPDASTWTFELLRSKLKPARKLTAYYRITPGPVSGEEAPALRDGGRYVAVTWFAERQPGSSVPPAAGPGAPPVTQLASASEDGRIVVRVCPDDPAMPQLARLNDTAHLAALLGDLSGRRVAARQLTVDTIRYRPGQRHVQRVRLAGNAWVYVKTDRDDSGARAVATAAFLRDRVAGEVPDATVARPLGYVAEDATAVWWNIPGTPLSRQLSSDPDAALRTVGHTGRLLRVLHDSASGPASLLGRGGADVPVEVEETLRAGEHVAALLPGVGRTFEHAASDVAEGLHRVPGEATALSHGDFKSDNLVVHGSRLTVLDLDRAAWADPAKDLGKFLVDLRWWCPGAAPAAALAVAFRAGYGPCDEARWARARLFAALFQLKLTARRRAVHDARWGAQVRAGVGDAVEMLRVARGA